MRSLIEIEEKVCEVFGVTSEFIHEKGRSEGRALIRYVIGYTYRQIYGKNGSLKDVSWCYGISRTTMQYGLKVVANEIDTDPKFKADMIEVFKRLGEKTNLVDEREDIKIEIIDALGRMRTCDQIAYSDYTYLFDLINKL